MAAEKAILESRLSLEEDIVAIEMESEEYAPPAPRKLNPAFIIAIWISLSSAVIMFNKVILSNLAFPFPIFLTAWHLTFATIATRVLALTTSLLDGIHDIEMDWHTWFTTIVPIGALFSASIILGNVAYLTLSVSFIQMLKAFTAVAVLLMSAAAGLEKLDRRILLIALTISGGVAWASYGEIHFVLSGFLAQTLAVFFEACKLVAIQKLLHGMKMNPLVSLYYFAPVCAAINLSLVPFLEGSAPLWQASEKLGSFILMSNACMALLLNIASVFLIGCASSLVLTFSGVLKDILLVIASVLLLGSQVTFQQCLGYGIALTGLVLFKLKQEVVNEQIQWMRTRFGR